MKDSESRLNQLLRETELLKQLGFTMSDLPRGKTHDLSCLLPLFIASNDKLYPSLRRELERGHSDSTSHQ